VCTTIATYYSFLMTVYCPGWITPGWMLDSNPTRLTKSHLKRIISTNFCVHTLVPLDDGPRYARNM